jgi:Flp pilus assembly protein TadG
MAHSKLCGGRDCSRGAIPPITRPDMRLAERGAALVEFALAVPLMLVVFAGIVDFGFAFQRYEVITNAAREGARMATLPGYGDPNTIDAYVRSYVQQGLSLSDSAMTTVMPSGSVTVSYADLTVPAAVSGTMTVSTATVNVSYQHTWLLLRPMLSLLNKSWGTTITLTASSQMRMEM